MIVTREKPVILPAKTKNIKLETTCNSIWPANIFAKSRSAKLITLNMYEIISIQIKNGTNTYGIPFGKTILKNKRSLLANPNVITVNHINIAHINVFVKWLVIINAKESSPTRFPNKINKNI
jgi:hypothetical protein